MHRKLSRSESLKDCMDRHPVLDGSPTPHVPFFQSSSITERPAATASHMKNKWRVLKECMPATSLVTRGRAIVAYSVQLQQLAVQLWVDREKGGNTPHIRQGVPTDRRARPQRAACPTSRPRVSIRELRPGKGLSTPLVHSAGRRVLLVSYSCVWTRSQTRVCCVQVVLYRI